MSTAERAALQRLRDGGAKINPSGSGVPQHQQGDPGGTNSMSTYEIAALQRLYELHELQLRQNELARQEQAASTSAGEGKGTRGLQAKVSLGPELRVDPADGNAYDFADFIDFYGLEAEERWAQAVPLDASMLESLRGTEGPDTGKSGASGAGLKSHVSESAGTGAQEEHGDAPASSVHPRGAAREAVRALAAAKAAGAAKLVAGRPPPKSLWQVLDPSLLDSIVDDVTILRDLVRQLRQERKIRRLKMEAFDPDAEQDRHANQLLYNSGAAAPIDYVRGWRVVERVTAHSSSVTCLALALSASILVSGSEDGEVRLWGLVADAMPESGHATQGVGVDRSDRERLTESGQTAKPGTTTLYGTFFSGASASTSRGDSIQDTLASEGTSTLLTRASGAVKCIECLGFASHLVAVAAANDDVGAVIRIWDILTRSQHQVLRGHSDVVSCLTCALSFGAGAAAVIISGSEDKSLKVWEANSGTCIRTMKGHHDSVWSVCCPSKGAGAGGDSTVISGSWDCTIRIWDFTTGECRGVISAAHSDGIWSLCCCLGGPGGVNGPNHVAGGRSGSNGSNGSNGSASVLGPVKRGVFSASLSGAAQGMRGSEVVKGTEEPQTRHEAADASHVHLVSGSWDKQIKVWDLSTAVEVGAGSLQQVHVFRAHTFSVTGLAALPGTPLLVSSSEDRTLRVWNVHTGEPLAVLLGSKGGRHAQADGLPGHTDGVRCVVALPDGVTLISGGWDKRLVLWRVEPPL